jgi:biopolymer transport protein ExbB/TolQ
MLNGANNCSQKCGRRGATISIIHTWLLLVFMSTIVYNVDMKTVPYQMMRVRKTTHHMLRKIAAWNNETLLETVERLAQKEWKRILERQKERSDATLQKDQNRSE